MTRVAGNLGKPKERKKRILQIFVIIAVIILVLATLWLLIAANATFPLVMLILILLITLCFFIFFQMKKVQEKRKNNPSAMGTKSLPFLNRGIEMLFRDLALGYIVLLLVTIIIGAIYHETFTATKTVYEVLEYAGENPTGIKGYMKSLLENIYPDHRTSIKGSVSDNNPSQINAGMENKEESSAIAVSDNDLGKNRETNDSGDNNGNLPSVKSDIEIPLLEANDSDDESANDVVLSLEAYDFSPLYFWGDYEFRDYIAGQDISNMQELYDAFVNNKAYADLLDTPTGISKSYGDILEEIESFDSNQRTNEELITSEDLYQDAMNRLFCYKEKGDVKNLEQSAISAEGAVEKEDIIASGGYNNYIKYTKTAIINFFCVSGSDVQEYDSGSLADVKYRIGKLFYRPSTNLLRITSNEKYYSLCSAYLVSKEAYDLSNSECNYAVDIAYYHLKICADIVSYMEAGEVRDQICREASGVYAELITRIEESGKSIYEKYKSEAEQLIERTDNLLGYDV